MAPDFFKPENLTIKLDGSFQVIHAVSGVIEASNNAHAESVGSPSNPGNVMFSICPTGSLAWDGEVS